MLFVLTRGWDLGTASRRKACQMEAVEEQRRLMCRLVIVTRRRDIARLVRAS